MPYKQVSLSLGASLGNLEGIRLLRLLFLDPEIIKILSLGGTWNFGKGTGLSWADIRLWGTKGQNV